MKGNLIDFPCSSTWRDYYYEQGLTPLPSPGYFRPLLAHIEQQLASLQLQVQAIQSQLREMRKEVKKMQRGR